MWRPIVSPMHRGVSPSAFNCLRGLFRKQCSTKASCIEGQIERQDKASLQFDQNWVFRPAEALLEDLRHSNDGGGRGLSPIGQPIHETHPHLVAKDEITQGVTKAEYQKRRRTLASLARRKSEIAPDMRHIILISASTMKMMANDIPYPFRQETNFHYLTGLLEPDAILMIDVRHNSEKSTLFVKPKDPGRELWDGPLSGLEAAVSHFGAEEAFSLSSLVKVLREKLSNKDPCIIWQDRLPTTKSQNVVDQALGALAADGTFPKHNSSSLQTDIELMRLIKSKAEIKLMKKCGNIISNAFARAMRSTRAGLEESIIHITIEYECRLQGAQRLSFPPVVAGGSSANTLHYISNSQVLRDGDLVLVDAGCEFNGYTSDVSRTWPVSGQFSKHQRTLYEIVLSVQETCIKAAVVGSSLNQLHQLMLSELGKQLKEKGVIANATQSNLQYIASSFCPHHVGHYLGMDTHDTPSASRQLPLQPGAIITIEPGLYISSDEQRVPDVYRGIGIRIEDNILIADDGAVVLTDNCPKTVSEIEETMRVFKR